MAPRVPPQTRVSCIAYARARFIGCTLPVFPLSILSGCCVDGFDLVTQPVDLEVLILLQISSLDTSSRSPSLFFLFPRLPLPFLLLSLSPAFSCSLAEDGCAFLPPLQTTSSSLFTWRSQTYLLPEISNRLPLPLSKSFSFWPLFYRY